MHPQVYCAHWYQHIKRTYIYISPYRHSYPETDMNSWCVHLEGKLMLSCSYRFVQEPAPLTYKKYEVLNLPVKRQWETVHIDPEVCTDPTTLLTLTHMRCTCAQSHSYTHTLCSSVLFVCVWFFFTHTRTHTMHMRAHSHSYTHTLCSSVLFVCGVVLLFFFTLEIYTMCLQDLFVFNFCMVKFMFLYKSWFPVFMFC